MIATADSAKIIVKSRGDDLQANDDEEDNKPKFKAGALVDQLNDPDADVDKEAIKDTLRNLTQDEAFAAFDADDDGLVNYNEFRMILPYIGVKISDAKSFRYFKMCDTRQCGKLDIDDFKAALFACDPVKGNTTGFQPRREVSPLDAFETFDEDKSGFLDEDEWFFAMEYLGYRMNDKVSEDSFVALDYDEQGQIDWEEFKRMYVEICDVRKELENRDVELPVLASKRAMRRQLRSILADEEIRERRAIAEAKRFMLWTFLIRDKRRFIQEAHFRAYRELRTALDMAGHVYVFGRGANKQFQGNVADEMKTAQFKFEHFDRIMEIWTDRVVPKQLVNRLRAARNMAEAEAKRDEEKAKNVAAEEGVEMLSLTLRKKIIIDPYREARVSHFRNIVVARNTAALWGRRIHHVTMSESVVFAMADSGEVFVFGGKSHWWDEIQPDSIYQTTWKGDVTPRSQLVMGIRGNLVPKPPKARNDAALEDADERYQEVVKTVCKYFNCWEPPPNPEMRNIFFERELLPKIEYDEIILSLFCRGKVMEGKTKVELIELLYDDIILETRLLGERGHRMIKKLEGEYAAAKKRNRTKLMDQAMRRLDDIWQPLREMQAESRAREEAKRINEENEAKLKIERDYVDYRKRVAFNREEIDPDFSPGGDGLEIIVHGVTPRGPDPKTPRLYQAGVQISAGNSHVAMVHRSGQLYTWGMGAAGRLGQDMSNGDANPQSDVIKPKLVMALAGRPVVRVSTGYAHNGAIVLGGQLHMWGSVNGGKCGLGEVVERGECYCSVPTRVMVGAEDTRVVRVSCGSGHTAVVTEAGQLYVFGCGDGGRLGQGLDRYENLYVPTLVESLLHERVASVSCGNSTTIAVTMIKTEMVDEDGVPIKKLVGGRVYIAGTANVFGKLYPSFTLLEKMKDKPVRQASAGFRHSALVTADGELYTWGFNVGGCLGHPESINFLAEPTVIKAMHSNAEKISLDMEAKQSSVYNQREARYAVNGDTSGKGLKKCTCTQLDKQAWIEIDLGELAIIETIKVWNRTDVPADRSQRGDFYTSRLFPCWLMVGNDPFSIMPESLDAALKDAVAKTRFSENQRLSTWHCQPGTQGRYIRLQLEGKSFLNIAELEVFGHRGLSTGVGRVHYVCAGRDATVVVMRPVNDPALIERAYCRAVYADAKNADILRQYETYALEYDKYGRGEVLMDKCPTCIGSTQCETCSVYFQYEKELEHIPPTLGGRRHTLDEIEHYLINAEKPPLHFPPIPRKRRPGWWIHQFREFVRGLRKSMRLKELPRPPPPTELIHHEDGKKREEEEQEDADAFKENESVLAKADNRLLNAMPVDTQGKYKKRARRARKHRVGSDAGSVATLESGESAAALSDGHKGDLGGPATAGGIDNLPPLVDRRVRFIDTGSVAESLRSSIASALPFMPGANERKLMDKNGHFKSALPKAVVRRRLEDLETNALIIEMKEEAERLEMKRKSMLSMTSGSRAPSSAAGQPGENSLLRKSAKL